MSTGLPISQWPNERTDYPPDWVQHYAPAGDNVPGNATEKATFANYQRLMQGRVDTIANLRSLDATTIPADTRLSLDGHTVPSLGGGVFRLIKDGSVGANKDDNGVTIFATGGPAVGEAGAWYWQRVLNGRDVMPEDFGAVGDASVTVRPGVPTPSDGGTDDYAALQAWLNYGTSGIGDNGKVWSVVEPANLKLGPRTYRTNQALVFNQPTGGNQSIVGSGQRQSVIIAGATMGTMLDVITDGNPATTYSFNDLRDFGLNGADYAQVGINAVGCTGTEWLRVRVQAVTQTCARFAGWNNRVVRCTFQGSAFDGTTRVALAIELPDELAINGLLFENCSIVRCLRGVDISSTPQRLSFTGTCVFDAITEAAIVSRNGSRSINIDDNYFEDCGTGTTQVTLAGGDTRDLPGPIVLSRAATSGAFTVRSLQITKNRFSDCGNETVVSAHGLDDYLFENNSVRPERPVSHLLKLYRDGAFYTTSQRVRVAHVYGLQDSTFSASAADPGTNTLTIAATSLAVGIPIRVTASTIGGLANGRYFSASGGTALTSCQLASTIANAKAGTLIDITATGTATLQVEDQIAEPIGVDDVSDVVSTTSGIEVDVRKLSTSLRGYFGGSSLGGSPENWTEPGGAFTISTVAGYEASPALQLVSTGSAERRFQFSLEQQDANNYYTLRGRYFRIHGVVQIVSGSALIVEWFINTGGGLQQYASQSRGASTWEQFRGFLCPIPKDATEIMVRLRTAAATTAKLARFSVCDAATPPDLVPTIPQS